MKIRLIALSSILILTKMFSFAQGFNPTITVNLKHPPALGLIIEKVSFNTNQSECSEQVLNPIISDFVKNKVEVIDRENFNAMLSEHNLSLSGYIDKNTASAIGKILGPSAFVTIKVLRCETVQNNNLFNTKTMYNYKTKQNYNVREYISRTQFFLKASIQVTDLTSGKIYAAKTFDYAKEMSNSSIEGQPVLPSKFDVQEIAFKAFAWDVYKQFFYWHERVELTYFDDVSCDLKSAYQLLAAGDIEGAYKKSIDNLENCKQSDGKEKFLAHAYYNVGMSHFIKAKYDQAVSALLKSQSIKDNSSVKNAIIQCQKAKNLSLQRTKIEERAAIEAESDLKEASMRKEALLDNNEIVKLVKAGLSENIIKTKIEGSECNFDMSTDAIISLKKAGVSDSIIEAMMIK